MMQINIIVICIPITLQHMSHSHTHIHTSGGVTHLADEVSTFHGECFLALGFLTHYNPVNAFLCPSNPMTFDGYPLHEIWSANQYY